MWSSSNRYWWVAWHAEVTWQVCSLSLFRFWHKFDDDTFKPILGRATILLLSSLFFWAMHVPNFVLLARRSTMVAHFPLFLSFFWQRCIQVTFVESSNLCCPGKKNYWFTFKWKGEIEEELNKFSSNRYKKKWPDRA